MAHDAPHAGSSLLSDLIPCTSDFNARAPFIHVSPVQIVGLCRGSFLAPSVPGCYTFWVFSILVVNKNHEPLVGPSTEVREEKYRSGHCGVFGELLSGCVLSFQVRLRRLGVGGVSSRYVCSEYKRRFRFGFLCGVHGPNLGDPRDMTQGFARTNTCRIFFGREGFCA